MSGVGMQDGNVTCSGVTAKRARTDSLVVSTNTYTSPLLYVSLYDSELYSQTDAAATRPTITVQKIGKIVTLTIGTLYLDKKHANRNFRFTNTAAADVYALPDEFCPKEIVYAPILAQRPNDGDAANRIVNQLENVQWVIATTGIIGIGRNEFLTPDLVALMNFGLPGGVTDSWFYYSHTFTYETL